MLVAAFGKYEMIVTSAAAVTYMKRIHAYVLNPPWTRSTFQNYEPDSH